MPDPLLADVDIANNALGRIGERPLSALDEDTDLAAQVGAVYRDVVDAAIAAYQWKWCRRTEPLQLLQSAPSPAVPAGTLPYPGLGPVPGPATNNGWPYAFSFPTDALSQPLGLYISWPSQPLRDFAVEGARVYARVAAVYGTFARRLGPSDWPPLFRIAVTTWLAAELAVPVTHDKDFAGQLMAEAVGTPSEQQRGGKMGRAIAMDAATGGPPAAFAQDPLTEARWQGAWHGSA